MTTQKKKLLTVTLTDRAPIRIDPDNWPLVADASDHDGQVRCQANNEYWIKVRQHNDGRTLVYGAHVAGDGGQYMSFRESRAGVLLTPESSHVPGAKNAEGYTPYYAHPDIVSAIREVAENANCQQLAAECIADLPAEDLT